MRRESCSDQDKFQQRPQAGKASPQVCYAENLQRSSLGLENLEQASCLCALSHSRLLSVIFVHEKEAMEETCCASLRCLRGMERGGGVFISIYSIDECNTGT